MNEEFEKRQGSEWPSTEMDKTFAANVEVCNEDGTIQATGHYVEEILQSPTTTFAQHYGFASRLPGNTEAFAQDIKSDEWLVHMDNYDRPTLPTTGQVMIFDNDSAYITLVPGSKIEIKDKNSQKITLQPGSKIEIEDENSKKITMSVGGDITIDAGIQKIVLKAITYLGSATATEPLLKGAVVSSAFTAWFTALNTFFQAWQTQLGNLAGAADPVVQAYGAGVSTALSALQTALSTIQGTIATWISTKHKLDV